MSKKLKVYISGAISGQVGYKKEFERAEEMLKSNGYVPINPVKLVPRKDNGGEPFNYTSLLFNAIYLLRNCDAIYFLPSWKHSKGSHAEKYFALACDIGELKL
jgi:hypothetical protein